MTNFRHFFAMLYLWPLTTLSLEAANLNTQQYFLPQYYQGQQQPKPFQTTASQLQPQAQPQPQAQLPQQVTKPLGQILGYGGLNTNTIASSDKQHVKPMRHPQLQPSPVAEPNVLDRYNIRYPDGSYEFRYELSDGTARYERGYFLRYDKLKTLVVVGYYSYRMPDGRYITVFYNADQHGYRQNQSITPQTYPNLPRSIEVPQFRDDDQTTTDIYTDVPLKPRDETLYK